MHPDTLHLGYSVGSLTVRVNARGLVAHEDTEYEHWGFSGTVAYTPNVEGRGLNLKVGSTWGAAQSGVAGLRSRETASGLAKASPMNAAQRFQAEFGYGFAGRKGRAVRVPYVKAESAHGASRLLQLGVKFTAGRDIEAGLELGQRASP